MRFQCLSRHDGIGSSSFLVEMGGARVVMDAGTHPRIEGRDTLPDFDALGGEAVDAAVITHSHLDHIGALPVFCEHQPRARVLMSEPSVHLVDAMLHNSVNVMVAKREELGITDYPFFTHREIERIVERWEGMPTRRPFEIGGRNGGGGVRCTFYDAGHVMGSVGVRLEAGGKSLFYTGDVHLEDRALSRAADFPVDEPCDILVMETTRGAVQRDPGYTLDRELGRLADAINETNRGGGSVLIPVFALGKTQEILLSIHLLKEADAIPDMPVFIGGLSTKVTLIFDRFASRTRRNHQGFRIMKDMAIVQTPRRQRNREMKYEPGCIYALSSGMMTEKTVSNGFAKTFIDNPRNGLFFVGYTDPASPGGMIRNAEHGHAITLDPESEPVDLLCRVESFDFSGHATRDQLVGLAKGMRPKTVVLVHGDPAARAGFEAELATALPGVRVVDGVPAVQVDF